MNKIIKKPLIQTTDWTKGQHSAVPPKFPEYIGATHLLTVDDRFSLIKPTLHVFRKASFSASELTGDFNAFTPGTLSAGGIPSLWACAALPAFASSACAFIYYSRSQPVDMNLKYLYLQYSLLFTSLY